MSRGKEPDSVAGSIQPVPGIREIYAGNLSPKQAITAFRNMDRMFPTSTIECSQTSTLSRARRSA